MNQIIYKNIFCCLKLYKIWTETRQMMEIAKNLRLGISEKTMDIIDQKMVLGHKKQMFD